MQVNYAKVQIDSRCTSFLKMSLGPAKSFETVIEWVENLQIKT